MPTISTPQFTSPEGRAFDIEWREPENARWLWNLNDSHHAGVLSPLSAWNLQDSPGRLRAFAEAGVDAPAMFRGFEVQNGFQYSRVSPLSAEEQREFTTRSRAFAARHGGACNVWPLYSLPRIQETVAWIRDAPIDVSVREFSAAFNYAFYLTHIAGQTMFQPLLGRLQALLEGPFGPSRAVLLCQEVGQGADNATVASDRSLATMARLAHAHPVILEALRTGRVLTRADAPEASAFFDEWDSYRETYRHRARSWGLDHPTVEEDPGFAWDMVRAATVAPRDPDELRRAALQTRDAAISEIRQALAAEPEKLAEALAIVDELGDYVAVREGRALWQLTAGGTLRTRLLEKGDLLVARGIIARRDDILFLLPDEIDPLFDTPAFADCRPLVAERRAEYESWATATAPRFITGNAELLPGRSAVAPAGVIHGLAGSRGTVTARARVVMDLDDADALEAGEVLVCVMTSPPWTPLFGVACAIVTDSGMALSHPAIAAREYGIPCVVGAVGATRQISTGDTVTVDGDAGTVTIVQRAE
jgi:phosphohistidine swiveling domain-containing protein